VRVARRPRAERSDRREPGAEVASLAGGSLAKEAKAEPRGQYEWYVWGVAGKRSEGSQCAWHGAPRGAQPK
jgi:hypothetical protein